ncbi:MAG: type II secretion system F family protein, partial [Demequina sp.]|nr:type II secretion system F family protein [Demequina sp.]
MTEPISLVAVAALTGAAVRSGLDVRGALDHVGRACGGDAQALCAVAAALGVGVSWEAAWDVTPSRFEALARALAPAWHRGASPVDSLAALNEALLDTASAAGESAAAELGVRIALPLALCLMPAFVLTGIVPLLVALAGSVMGGA